MSAPPPSTPPPVGHLVPATRQRSHHLINCCVWLNGQVATGWIGRMRPASTSHVSICKEPGEQANPWWPALHATFD